MLVSLKLVNADSNTKLWTIKESHKDNLTQNRGDANVENVFFGIEFDLS